MLNLRRWDPPGKGPVRALVVMCHGVGSEAEEMHFFYAAWAATLPGAAFVAPDGPEPYEHFPIGRQWFSLDDLSPAVLDAGARRAAPLLDAVIDEECARLGLAETQVALVGFSQGAAIVLQAGLRRRPAVAAVLAYSGALLDRPDLVAASAGAPPFMLIHGESDDVVPAGLSVGAAGALRRLGLPVELLLRPGVGHVIEGQGMQAGGMFLARHLPGAAAAPG